LASSQKTAPASKQKTATVTEEYLIKAEAAIAERDYLRIVTKNQAEQLANKDEQIKALNALKAIESLRAESWMKAATDRAAVNTIDEERVKLFLANEKLYQASIADFKLDRERIISERDSARKSQKWWGIVGAGLGYLIGSRGK
jgi:hypothetical protein